MQSAASSSLIPPSTYVLKWDGRHVRFFLDASTEKTDATSLIIDDPPSYDFSDKKQAEESIHHSEHVEKHANTEETKSDFYLQCTVRAYMLFDGSDNIDQSRRLIDVKPEGCWLTTSTYREAQGPYRETTMYKPAWYSGNRVMEDFEGNKYTWKASFSFHLTCVRSDDTVVAYFRPTAFSWSEVGKLEIKTAVSPEVLHLIFCATIVRYKQLKRRRRRHMTSP